MRKTGQPAARPPLAEPDATSSSEFHGYLQYQNPCRESRSAPSGRKNLSARRGRNDSVGAQVEELERSEAAIDPVGPREELPVAARLHDPALMDHHHPVRIAYRAEPVSNDEQGPPPHEVGQRVLDQ